MFGIALGMLWYVWDGIWERFIPGVGKMQEWGGKVVLWFFDLIAHRIRDATGVDFTGLDEKLTVLMEAAAGLINLITQHFIYSKLLFVTMALYVIFTAVTLGIRVVLLVKNHFWSAGA